MVLYLTECKKLPFKKGFMSFIYPSHQASGKECFTGKINFLISELFHSKLAYLFVCWLVLMLSIPVDNYSVM